MTKKVMVILADGCEESEAATIIDVMRRAGIRCDGVSIGGEIVRCQHGMRLLADQVLTDSLKEYETYDAVILPGGWSGTDNMKADERLLKLLQFYADASDRYLAAMCAAPSVLAFAGVTRGKTLTSYPDPKLESLFTDANYVTDTVVVDEKGRLITSRGPGTVLPFSFAVVDALGGDSKTIKERFLYSELKNCIE